MIANAVRRLPRHVLLALALCAVLTGVTIFLFHGGVNSPDEAANLLFIESWSARLELSVPIGMAQPRGYPLFPRSTSAVGERVVPTGFVGLPIFFGSIAAVLGSWSVYYITVLLTLIASLGWWYLMRQIFNRAVADISLWLFLFHPAVLYYSVRGLFPNMLLMDLVIIAVASAWFAVVRHSRALGALAVAAAILAIAVRPPEAFALCALVALATCVCGTERRVRRLGGVAFAALLCGAIVLWLAREVGVFTGGYQFISSDSLVEILFPFGIHVSRVWHTAVQFIVQLFAPWVLISSAGLAWWLWHAYRTKSFDRAVLGYLMVIVPASLWLFVLYGSWSFSDNPADPSAVTMGSSYVRYWLPHLVFRMPFAAVLVLAVIAHWKLSAKKITTGFIIVMVVLGVWRAAAGVDGLRWLIGEVTTSRATVSAVLAQTPRDAVIAVRAWDKFFFPHRAVLQPFPRDVRTFAAARELLTQGRPVFAFVETLDDTGVRWLHTNGVAATARTVYGVHTLYELMIWNGER